MIQDEFNKVDITNDKQIRGIEFGKTQKMESTSQKENKIPEGDLNEKYVGKTIKKVTEINVDYVNKVPTHASQTVVQGSTTATTAAAATTSVAVAASTVVVVAVATVTGISVALHDYKYEFKSLIISSNELRYELYVYDAMQSEEDYYLSFEEDVEPEIEEEYDESSRAPFKLRVYNKNYDATQYVWGYSTNYGVFDHLTLGDTYSIVLSENRYGGEEIYKDTFTTYVNSSITDFVLYENADFKEGTFECYLDYSDDDNLFSDFVLEFYEVERPERVVLSFPLEKKIGAQTLSLFNEDQEALIDLDKEWGYRLTYSRDGQTLTYKEDKITFVDYLGRKSEFNEFVLNREANFKENTIEVRIDYVDGYEYYDDFNLILTQVPAEDDGASSGQEEEERYYSQEIPLESTNETQTIDLNEYEMFVKYDYFKYTYRLTCNYRGNLVTLAEETTPFSFTDMSGAKSEFNGFEFKKEANFLTNTFKVNLDYVDDFERLYSFTLHLFPNGVNAQYDFYLDKTTEEQTCTFNENDHWMFSFDYEYSYTLTYWNDSEEITYTETPDTPFTFTDISGGKSVVNGVTFTGQYVMSTGMAEVQLDYQDDFGYLDDFTLHLLGPIVDQSSGDYNPVNYANSSGISIDDYPYEISLEKTLDVQYFNVNEYGIELGESKYIYALTYTYRGNEVDPIHGSNQIEFFDPDAESVVNGLTFVNNEANFNTREFYVQLDFQDDYGYFSNFTLQMWDDTYGGFCERQLEKTTEPQKLTIDDYDYNEYKYPVDIAEGDLTYNFYYTTSETGDPSTQYFFEQSQPITFTNSLKSEFYGFECSYDFTTKDNGELVLPFRFNCVNDAEYFSAPELYITPTDNDEDILATISFANEVMDDGWQYGSFSPYGSFTIEELTNGDYYNVIVACYEKDGYNGAEQRMIKFNEPHAFTLDQKQEIYNAHISDYIIAGNWEMYMSLIANGQFDMFADGELILTTSDDETYTYDLSLAEYPTVQLNMPKEGNLTDDEIEAILANPVSVSIRYCTLKQSTSGTGYDKSEPITIECLSSYQFWVSH